MAESNSHHKKPEEDRISSLPDPLLIHILSFLPSKTSVQTSILSHRWRHFWKHLSVLNLSDDYFEFNENLIQFKSQRFKDYLSFLKFSDDSFDFNSYRTEQFKDYLSVLNLSTDSLEFQDNVNQFNSERFKHFRRFFYFVNSLIYVLRPYQVQKMRLSCTKTLAKNAMCTASISAWIDSAVGPLIKELDITLDTIDNYCFWLPTKISQCSNLVSLSLKGALRFKPQLATSFSLPSLKKMELDIYGIDVTSLNAFLQGCPCLETLDLCWNADGEDYGRICVPPLRLPSSLKRLKIVLKSRAATKRLLSDVTHLHFPNFDNLLHLDLNFLRFNSNSIISLLQKCHSLEVLIIQNDKDVCIQNDKEDCNDKEEQSSLSKWAAQPSVSSCLESHLRFIRFKRYRGSTDEFYFAEYILQKGRVLKTMIITDISAVLKEKLGTLKRLSNVPRASRMCQLIFE